MKLVFRDQAFSFELLRAVGYSTYAGADIGECLATAARIREGDFESWYEEWSALARRAEAIARASLSGGHPVSAREAFLRASNYYRTAEFFLRIDPHDPRAIQTWESGRACFSEAAKLFTPAFEPVEIPYGDTSLPGYFFRVDDSGAPRPTLVLHGGFDSTLEELYFCGAAAALRRGYNCLAYEGPGQGRVIRRQKLHFRPDWENVVTPVMDYVLARPEVDRARVALMGMSQGGYFAPRAAAFEHRLAACVAWDGVYDVMEAATALMPPFFARHVTQESWWTSALFRLLTWVDPTKRWLIANGMWTYGARTPRELFAMNRAYSLEGIAQRIQCPTLVCCAEGDHFFRGQPERLYEALSCQKAFARFTAEEGAEEHCHEGALALFHQRVFDWLDEVMPPAAVERSARPDEGQGRRVTSPA